MNIIMSKTVNSIPVILIALDDGGYQIKSGNLTQTFSKTPFEKILSYYALFK